MTYNVVIIDGELTIHSLKSKYNDFDELIRYTLFNPRDFFQLEAFAFPIDVYVLRILDNENIPHFLKKIRQISHFSFIPIIVVDNAISQIDLLSQEFELVDGITEEQYLDNESLVNRILFLCKTTNRYKKFQGENTILKSKLIELERLRIKNDFLFTSTKSLEDMNQELMHQRDEIETQKKEIENEKRKSEELLKNILPEETSRELMIHGEAKTQFYKKVTVLFSDFQGFTKTCENMPPQLIVKELATHFSKFEEYCEDRYVEKIKTIGDAYMCAGGIPMRNNSNPIDVVLVGLDIVRYIEESNKRKIQEGLVTWNLRIGIHTGNLIAGVIGKKKFAYDIWGDTVNTASRMETSGEINKVNISGNTYEYVKDFFTCIARGKIEAKNKGFVDMYFVSGIKPELSINGKGILPNKDFIAEYSKL
jgi:class 3 adenylate cyclase